MDDIDYTSFDIKHLLLKLLHFKFIYVQDMCNLENARSRALQTFPQEISHLTSSC